MAASHGLSPSGTLDDLRNSIVSHITEGACTQFETILSPPACAEIRTQCPDEFSKMPDSESDATFTCMRVFFLSQLTKKIRRRPLCRLLKLYDIGHDSNSSFNVLR